MLKELVRQTLQDVFWNKQDDNTVVELVNARLRERDPSLYCRYHNGRLTIFAAKGNGYEEGDEEVLRLQILIQVRVESTFDA